MIIKLLSNKRPLFMSSADGESDDILTLFDTGAEFSVWTSTLEHLQHTFSGAKNTGKKIYIGGFGGTGSLRDVYVIPTLYIGSTTIHYIPVAVFTNIEISSDLVLSSAIFEKCKFAIDYTQRKLYTDDISTIRCGIRSNPVDSTKVNTFYVFSGSDLYEEILQKYCCNLTEQQKELVRTCTETLRDKDIELFEAGVKSCIDNL